MCAWVTYHLDVLGRQTTHHAAHHSVNTVQCSVCLSVCCAVSIVLRTSKCHSTEARSKSDEDDESYEDENDDESEHCAAQHTATQNAVFSVFKCLSVQCPLSCEPPSAKCHITEARSKSDEDDEGVRSQ